MSTQTFRRQTQIVFDVNVKVNNTDTSGNIVKDDITLYYADSLILDIAMGLYDDTVKNPIMLYSDTTDISIQDIVDTPYTRDLRIYIYYADSKYLDDLKNYVDSLKDYKKYKDVIKCSPFFRATPLVYKNTLGLKPTCWKTSTKYKNYYTSDVLITEKDWRNVYYETSSNYLLSNTFYSELLYNICSMSISTSSTASIPYHYGDGLKYYKMTSSSYRDVPNNKIVQTFGREIAYQLRRMSDEEYAELVNVWLEKVKETCYEDVKTRVDGEYVGGLDLDFSEFVAQRPYNV